MNWEAIGAIGDFVGGIAVVVTLLYLVAQVRQNTKMIGTSAYAQLCSQFSDLSYTIAANPDLTTVWFKGLSDPSELRPDEFGRFRTLTSEFYFALEDMFRLWEQGLIDSDTWRSQYENSSVVILSKGGSEALARRHGPISERLREYVAAHPPPEPHAA